MRPRDHGDQAADAVLTAVAELVAERGPRPAAVAEAIGTALGVEECVLTIDGQQHTWGTGTGTTARAAIGLDAAISVRPPRSRLGAVARELIPVIDLVRLGLAVDELRATGHRATAELADGRWRAAAEMDTERRRVERDLHDGTQHHLVALRIAVALADHAASTAPDSLPTHVAGLTERLAAAEETLVRTAAGVLPVALVADGLVAALDAELGTHDDVRLDLADDLPRYPVPVETAVYFVCLEAVNNAHKHAVGAAIEVRLAETDEGLAFAVRDDGPGFEGPGDGAGLLNLTSRVTAIGGTLRVASALGEGTTIEGFVPAEV
ncbi:ATP-binding protein [Actinokineospora sp. NBRC 105648]|uniref:sensor histidine kinase n=1 Tax=Actinokineospora sp. NBRC 105648 TaxID=3032206 RepID=UPI0024A0C465|nr:ATP-binding protein [Actinokineospora sp. NBRC 105648]GLZ43794.1 hypothetical protein Acsp05_74180 [Actinokineospora sp. NBRC 105648]